MLRHMLTVLALLALVCSSSGADDIWALRYDGVGPAKIGMTIPQLRVALQDRLLTDGDSGNEDCQYVKPAKHPHISFMILEGRFVRADVAVRGIATTDGIQV